MLCKHKLVHVNFIKSLIIILSLGFSLISYYLIASLCEKIIVKEYIIMHLIVYHNKGFSIRLKNSI